MVLNEADNIILDIIGKDSPVLDGLDVPESGDIPSGIHADEENCPPVTPMPTPRPRQIIRPLNRRPSNVDPNLTQKRKLQCELLEVEVYKRKLECLKMENDLALPKSKFTETL